MNFVHLQMGDFKPYRQHGYSIGAMVADKAFEFDNKLDGKHYSVLPGDIVFKGIAGECWAIRRYELFFYDDYKMDGKALDVSRIARGSSLEGAFTKIDVPDSPVVIWAAQVSVPDAMVAVPEGRHAISANLPGLKYGNGDFICCANSFTGMPDFSTGCWLENGLEFEKMHELLPAELALGVHEAADILNSEPNDESTHGLGKIAKQIGSVFHKESDDERRSRETDNLFRANDIYRQGQRDAEYKVSEEMRREHALSSRAFKEYVKEYEERTGGPMFPPGLLQEALKEKQNYEKNLTNLEELSKRIHFAIQLIRENGPRLEDGLKLSGLEALSEKFSSELQSILEYGINEKTVISPEMFENFNPEASNTDDHDEH